MKTEKDVLSVKIQTKKEAIKMIKKCLAVTLAALIVIFNVLPAQAYIELKTPVAITATGTIVGSTANFSATLIAQGGTAVPTTITFATPSIAIGITNSGTAIKLRGGTNEVGGRVIIYTDNATLFTSQDHDPRWKWDEPTLTYKPTGLDGSGLVGDKEKGYVAALVWACSTTPNTNPTGYAYPFTWDAVTGNPTNSSYVVDKWHNLTFVPPDSDTEFYSKLPAPFNTAAGLDGTNMYPATGTTPVTNVANEGRDASGNAVRLYPQNFGTLTVPPATPVNSDLYNKVSTDGSRVVVSQQLTKNIATIAYSIQPGTGADAAFYVCDVVTGVTTTKAKLGKVDGTAGTELYVNVGGIFTGLPAQIYSSTKLYVAIVQD